MFKVSPPKYTKAKVATTEIGTDRAITMVVVRLFKNTSKTNTAKNPPYIALRPTTPMACSMKRLWSWVATIWRSGKSALMASSSALTRLATMTVLASDCFCRRSDTLGILFRRDRDWESVLTSSTWPTSLSNTGSLIGTIGNWGMAPGRVGDVGKAAGKIRMPTTKFSISLMEVSCPTLRMRCSSPSTMSVPPGRLRLAVRRVPVTWGKAMPYSSSFVGSRLTEMAS